MTWPKDSYAGRPMAGVMTGARAVCTRLSVVRLGTSSAVDEASYETDGGRDDEDQDRVADGGTADGCCRFCGGVHDSVADDGVRQGCSGDGGTRSRGEGSGE